MFGYFHEMRNSSSFLLLWMNLFCEILGSQLKQSPIFYQYVTDVLFKEEVKRRFPVSTTATESSPLPALDYQERNAIRYAAGYVVRHLSKRLERTSHPLKEELVLCLVDMCTDEDDEQGAFADWTKQVDRGGLKNVNDRTFHVFLAMET